MVLSPFHALYGLRSTKFRLIALFGIKEENGTVSVNFYLPFYVVLYAFFHQSLENLFPSHNGYSNETFIPRSIKKPIPFIKSPGFLKNATQSGCENPSVKKVLNCPSLQNRYLFVDARNRYSGVISDLKRAFNNRGRNKVL